MADLKIFATSESKLTCQMKSISAGMERNVGLQWNPKKCAFTHIRRGILVANSAGVKVDGNAKKLSLEEGPQYKFLGVLDCLKQEEKVALKCAAKEYLRRMSFIWSSTLSDHHSVIASTQFAMPAISYFMWSQHWPMTELREIKREAHNIVVENGGKNPCGSTSLLYLPTVPAGRGLCSIVRDYKATKVKAALSLSQNRDRVMNMVGDFEKRTESVGHQSLTKEV